MSRIKTITIITLCTLLSCCQTPKTEKPKEINNRNQKELLLIGTFHYNNPGADVAKTKSFDILSEEAQNVLKQISSKIKRYNPTKIFVEWSYDEQNELDSLYSLYRANSYFTNDSLSDFYLKNEIFQLAFRVAKYNNMEKVYGIDYSTPFPFEEVMKDIENANQPKLMSEIQNGISKFTTDFDDKIESGTSLAELTYHLNSPSMRKFSNEFHNNLMLLAGNINDFNEPLLTSEWFKRNLYMWSLIQKNTTNSDERIMVLVGASHAAMFELFVRENDDWRIKELKEIMN